MDSIIFTLLKKEHQDAFELMSELEDISGQERRELFARLREELQRHMAMEEDSLYPALGGDKETKELVREFINDHEAIKNHIKGMGRLFVDGEEFDEMLEMLTESFEGHVREEESGLLSRAPVLPGEKKSLKKRVKSEKKKAA